MPPFLQEVLDLTKAALDKLMEAGFETGNMNIIVRE
jgi:hypothetical protein